MWKEPRTLGQRIAEARRLRSPRVTQAALAEHIKVTPQAVSGWERDESQPEIDKLRRISLFLDVPLTWLLMDTDTEAGDAIRAPVTGADINLPAVNIKAQAFPPTIHAGHELVGARDLPVYAATQGGDGHMIVTTEVIEYTRRPLELEGVKEGYGIRIVGDSMRPAYRDGDMALVHPRLQPIRDEAHVFYDHDPRSGEAESCIKNLISWNDRKWRVEQYNPADKFELDRVDWPICHRVVGKYNRR